MMPTLHAVQSCAAACRKCGFLNVRGEIRKALRLDSVSLPAEPLSSVTKLRTRPSLRPQWQTFSTGSLAVQLAALDTPQYGRIGPVCAT
jgi:hypothetical protein